MGFSVGWFALSDSTVEDVAAILGLHLGDPCDDDLTGPCIASIGRWVLVYNSGLRGPLIDDEELESVSVDRTVVVHQSVDTVMYSRTNRWDAGKLTWSASVNLDTIDDESAIATSGLSPAAEKRIHRTYQRSGTSAYSDIARMAHEIVGFRHDDPGTDRIEFRWLIDNSEKPLSIADQMASWLTSQGFQAKNPAEDGSKDRSFRRHVAGDFWVIARIAADRELIEWQSVSLGIHHDGAQAVLAGTKIRGMVRSADPFAPTAHLANAKMASEVRPPLASEPATFRSLAAELRDRITEAEAHCTEEHLLSICRPKSGLALEVALGWSNRSESYLEQTKLHNRLLTHGGSLVVPLAWIEAHRDSPRFIPNPGSPRSVDDLKLALESDETLSGLELAMVQAEIGASNSDLLDSLRFGHWLRVFDLGTAAPTISRHIVIKHLISGDAELIARTFDLPIEAQFALTNGGYRGIADNLGRNTRLAETIQIRLAEMGVSTVGQHPNLAPEAQRILMDSETGDLSYLAKNPALLPEHQPAFASSSNYRLRAALAGNPSITKDLLAKLVKDRKGDVKSAAASNPTLSEDLQLGLLNKKNKDTQLGLMRNPGLSERVQREVVDRGDLVALAGNVSLVRDLMDSLASDTNAASREALARNWALPIDLQGRLANDMEANVRRAIAVNHAADPAIRARLFEDADQSVNRAAQQWARQLGETNWD